MDKSLIKLEYKNNMLKVLSTLGIIINDVSEKGTPFAKASANPKADLEWAANKFIGTNTYNKDLMDEVFDELIPILIVLPEQ